MSTLRQQVLKGAAWMVSFRLIDRGIGFVSTLILARVLVPADFGLVAMAVSILAALELISAFSFDLVLIQNPKASRQHYDTAWTFNIIFGCFNFLSMALLASLASRFFSEPRLELLMYAFGVASLIQGFENIGIVAFQKDLELHKEFRFNLIKRLVGFAVTVSIAMWTQSYWALAVGTLATKLTGVSFSYLLHSYRPRLSLAAATALFSFSKWLLLNNFLIFVNNRGTDFVIGRMQGAGALGVYAISYELANLPTTELVWPIQRALFPGYARISADKERLGGAFLQMLSMLCLLTIPAGMLLNVAADQIVRILLGEKWLPAVSLIQILSIFGIVRALHGPTGSVFVALGKPRTVALSQSIQIGTAIVLMFYFIPRLGTPGAAWSILVGACLAGAANYALLLRELSLPISKLISVIWRPVVAGFAMGVCGHAIQSGLEHFHIMVQFLAVATLSLGIYLGLVFVSWHLFGRPPGGERIIQEIFDERWRSCKGATLGRNSENN